MAHLEVARALLAMTPPGQLQRHFNPEMHFIFNRHQLKTSGFTLIELMLVFALIAIMVGLTMPEFISFNKRKELQSVAQRLAEAIQVTQSLASGGVQSSTDFISSYNLNFTQQVGDPANYYRGYTINRIDVTAAEITPTLETKEFGCNICTNAPVDHITFKVPSGVVGNMSGSSIDLLVCYPTVGEQGISIDVNGKVSAGGFQSTSCTCPFSCP